MPGKFVLYYGDGGGISWVFISPNGRTLAKSFEDYPTEKSALKGIAAMRRLVPDAVVVEPDGPGQPTTEPRTVRVSRDGPPPSAVPGDPTDTDVPGGADTDVPGGADTDAPRREPCDAADHPA